MIPLNPDGTLQLDVVPGLFDTRTRLLAITEVSNVLGTENPLAALIALAHQHGAKVLVDGAQAVMHHPVDVQALGCDFYVFSGHKLYGPTGIGVLSWPFRATAGDGAMGRRRVDDRHRQPDGRHHLEPGAVAL